MPIGVLFWVLMVLWFLFGLYLNWPKTGEPPWAFFGGNLLLFILLFLLGWKVFGFVIQG